ncbi:DHH family phosphoesterase [Neobacillus sp. SM06]|uniref:DHH family phosphoesterase n=1 Tax=Neobacillus sp. SM06 TaxID=3422492 RepID=UPI003D270208
MAKLFTDIDLDGLGCGIVAKLAFGDKVDVSYCSYRNLNQRVEEFLENREFDQEELYITDLAVNEEVEKKLAKRFQEGKHVRVIDHHVTALHFNQYKWGLVKPEYSSGKKTCATSLFYEDLLEHKKINQNKSLEEFIDLVRQYDTWEWDENNNVTAKRLNDLFYILSREKLEEEILQRIASNSESFSLTDTENFVLDLEERKIDRYIHSKSRQIVQAFIDPYYIGIIHAEQYLSELGNELNKLYPHLDMIVLLNMSSKKIGFRTIHDTVDVAAFAKKYGGGGHPKASGCEMTEETFKKFVADVFAKPPLKPDPEKNSLNLKEADYGTAYQNREGKKFYIKLTREQKYLIVAQNRILGLTFGTFDEAERLLKRQYGVWLSYDDECVKDLAIAKQLPPEAVRNQYPELMRKKLEIN